ncbi:MAG TPA: murein L,D-transpeptidase, partial [Methylibium sp.]|nr:murein L,D-transpeptidase [Methylibium sp.]
MNAIRCTRRDWLALLAGLAGAAAAGPADDAAPWFDGPQPRAVAHEAAALLADAAREGLDPRDYGAASLQAALAVPAGDAAALGRALTMAMQRYLGDLHEG